MGQDEDDLLSESVNNDKDRGVGRRGRRKVLHEIDWNGIQQ